MDQFELAERATAALGVVVWPMTEFEADDAIATAAQRWWDAPGVEQVVICSPDKDLAQMVRGQRIVCLDRRRDIILDEAGVREKFGVGPACIADYLALVGDAADGIPGIPRWGAKTSALVLQRYQHLEQIPEDPSLWDGGPGRQGNRGQPGGTPPGSRPLQNAGHAAVGRASTRVLGPAGVARGMPTRV